MKLIKSLSILLLIFINVPNISAYENIYGELETIEKQVLSFGGNKKCENIMESDIPTIFIPGILASWYSEEGYGENKIKRWIPDPVTHSYDTLFYTFKENGYSLKDVFYKDEFNTYINGDPKKSLYLFGYDWKKDNKLTAKLLANLIFQIREEYESIHGCDIGTVNIIAHSMGGLVARAMLEDMCVSDEELLEYHNRTNLNEGELKEFSSNKCNYTRINRLVTISTPQRGSPSSFPMWTKGDMRRTDALFKSIFLKGQLGVSSDDEIYELIHGYDPRVENGIVTIGQLLPDIQNTNDYNKELIYLKQYGENLKNGVHPINNFLEELNREENIDKMFSNITKEYSLYYSSLTGNDTKILIGNKNNTIGYSISSHYTQDGNIVNDSTSKYRGKELNHKYPNDMEENIYNISGNIRNENGYGGDGTVPTNNLLLTSNDKGIVPDNSKYKRIKIQCYDDELFAKNGLDLNNIENKLSKKIGSETLLELCSHTKMPIISSIQVLEKISGKILVDEIELDKRIIKEQQLLYKYMGHAYYGSIYEDSKIFNSYDSKNVGNSGDGTLDLGVAPEINYSYRMGGIKNSDELEERFSAGVFNTLFTDENEINKFIVNKNSDSIKNKSLDFSGKLGTIESLLRYEVLSPINLIIEDEQGRRIGIDPETGLIINEIPGAWTSGNTEGTNEPEFFLIPKTSTGQILHQIHSYPTGEGEYKIKMNEIKSDNNSESNNIGFTISGFAKEGIIENYIVGIEEDKSGYKKINSEVYNILKKSSNNKKYGDILKKIYNILDKKYNQKQRNILKERLIEFKSIDYGKFKDNEKIVYLVGKIVDYLE